MPRKYKYDKEEAQQLMETEVRSSYYWTDTRNRSNLQAIIDALYNCVEGNNYIVECVQNQNSERLKVVCHVCRTDLSSYDPFFSHENGKSHKKVLQQILSPKDPNLSVKLQRKSLKCPKGIFSAGSLEDDLEMSEDNILGVHFLYKEMINGEERFTCTLCNKNNHFRRITKEDMYHHLHGIGHPSRYLEKKFGYTNLRHSELRYEAEKVVEKEGRIHGEIVDFTKQIEEKEEVSLESIFKEMKHSSKVKYKLETPKIPVVSQVPTMEKSVGCLEEDFKDMQQSLNILTKEESVEIVAKDGDMQSLLIHFNWLLADRLAKYYEQHSDEHVYFKDRRLNVQETSQKRLFNATKLAPFVYAGRK